MAYESRKTKDRDHWLQMRKEALRKRAFSNCLTLEETAVALWNPEKEKQPMTCMGILKIEKKALSKLRSKLAEYGIKDITDIFEPKYREYGKPISSVYGKN